ncbi:SDR family oxidoreductase [Akkermansiaceae bacterium]|nr:SDR family oxidoreductase [Akkermansiaceae bacterium]MDB4499028.1 SDR family oxidoreductase [Akkermansiaceae bacterium]
MSLFNLSGKIAVITGGYGHLGKAMSQGLLDAGAQVAVLARSEEKCAEAFPDVSDDLRFFECDIASTDSVKAAFSEVAETWGGIDILINNAFYLKGQAPLEISDEDWAVSMDGCLGSVYRGIREVVPYFEKREGGRIINISSMYGMVSPDFEVYADSPEFLNPPHYGATKAGVIQLTKYFSCYLGAKNILVNSISPGPFPSPEVQKKETFIKALNQRTALGRIGRPEELAGSLVFLSSEASSYMTGQNLVIDGGWTAS